MTSIRSGVLLKLSYMANFPLNQVTPVPLITSYHYLDVWSFGIVLWELFSYGKLPYYTYSNEEAVRIVLSGYRL